MIRTSSNSVLLTICPNSTVPQLPPWQTVQNLRFEPVTIGSDLQEAHGRNLC